MSSMSALSIFKGKNAKNKNIGRKVNPVNIASRLMYFRFTYELLAFISLNSFFSPWSMQIQYFNAYLRQYGP